MDRVGALPAASWVASLPDVLDNYPDGTIAVFDPALRYTAAGGRGLTDFDLTEASLVGHTIWEVLPSDAAAHIEPAYRAALQGAETIDDVQYGDRIYRLHVTPVRAADDTVLGGMVTSHDITELRASIEQLRVAEEQFRNAFEHAPIGMALVDLDGRFAKVNRALCEIVDYDEQQLLSMTFQEITHPDDLQIDLAHVERLLAGQIDSYRMEKRYFDQRGRIVWIQLSVSLVRDTQRSPLQFVSQIEDISQRKRDEAHLTRLAQRDLLTGLLNRAMFDRDLTSYQQAAERYGDVCSLLILDLDDFKAINDSAGHDAGDHALQQVAKAIRSRLRITDQAYRIGGDEFAVLLPHATGDAAHLVAASLREAIAELEITATASGNRIGASIGLSTVEAGGTTSPRHAADLAMYADKKHRRAAGSSSEVVSRS